MTRLSHSQRHEIARAYEAGEGPTAIGRRYGIGGSHVIMIAKRAGKGKKQQPARPKPPRVVVKAPPPIDPKPTIQPQPVGPEHVGSGQRHGAGYTKLM